MKILLTVGAVAATLMLTGCDILGLEGCTKEGRDALAVSVVDSATGGRLPEGTIVTIVASDGEYTDSVSVRGNLTIGLASERTGTYAVEIRAPGFQPWRQEGLRVGREDNSCRKVDTLVITARLQG